MSTYPIRMVSRMTGLSEQLIRTWEARYGAVRPERSGSGARRYSARDVRRLRLLARGTEAGFRISELAALDEPRIQARLAALESAPALELEPFLAAAARLDVQRLERLLALQLSVLGSREFALRVARPLLVQVGMRWQTGALCVASEHLISSALTGLLRAALSTSGAPGAGPRVVFAGLTGVRHELGLLVAAVCAQHAGVLPIYLGADLPVAEIAFAARESGARATALAAQMLSAPELRAQLRELRAQLGPGVRLWVGGAPEGLALGGSDTLLLESLDALEHELELLELEIEAR